MKTLFTLVGLGLVGCQPLILEPVGDGGGGSTTTGSGAAPACATATSENVWSNVSEISVAADPTGGRFLGGCFKGDLDLGGVALHGRADGRSTHFFAHLGTDGAATFTAVLGDRCTGERTTSVVANAAGEAALVGATFGGASINGVPLPGSSHAVLVVRYAAGALSGRQFAFTLNPKDDRNFFVPAAIGPSGEIALSVSAAETIDFGVGTTQYDDANIVMLTPDLEPAWVKNYPNTYADDHSGVNALAFAADGALLAGGTIMGETDFDGLKVDVGQNPDMSLNFDGFVMALDANGDRRWFRHHLHPFSDIWSIAALPGGGVWALISTSVNPPRAGHRSIGTGLAVHLDENGEVVSSTSFEDALPAGAFPSAIVATPDGGANVAGGLASTHGRLAYSTATWVAALDPAGAITWTCSFAATPRDYPDRIDLDGSGGLLIAGYDGPSSGSTTYGAYLVDLHP